MDNMEKAILALLFVLVFVYCMMIFAAGFAAGAESVVCP